MVQQASFSGYACTVLKGSITYYLVYRTAVFRLSISEKDFIKAFVFLIAFHPSYINFQQFKYSQEFYHRYGISLLETSKGLHSLRILVLANKQGKSGKSSWCSRCSMERNMTRCLPNIAIKLGIFACPFTNNR